MSEAEKEAIEFLEDLKNLEINYFADRFITGKVYLQDSEKEQIDKVLNYISKLQKAIDLMAQDRAEISEPRVSKEAIIDFYFKKVEEIND